MTTLERVAVSIPGTLLRGSGLRLIQAFPSGSSAMSIPQDQILITDDKVRPPHLMLPPGSYWIRAIDPQGNTLAVAEMTVRPLPTRERQSLQMQGVSRNGL